MTARSQLLLFPQPSSPAEFARAWCAPLLEEIPAPGHATSADWAGVQEAAKRWPGRNLPPAGAYIVNRYAALDAVCADPMIGVGGLWLRAPRVQLFGCEVEPAGAKLASRALSWADVQRADARTWTPPRFADLVHFSPPFAQNHAAGKNDHQRELRDAKRLHAMQQFGDHPDNIGPLRGPAFWGAMERVYERVHTYAAGVVVIVLRNRIRGGLEVDEVGEHLQLLRATGFQVVGVHPRDLVRPTAYQAMKVARDPRTPWIRWEWFVVARRATC